MTAAAIKANPSLPIDTIITLGTPWRGSPLADGFLNGGLWQITGSGATCGNPVGSLQGAGTATLIMLTQGVRDMSDQNDGYLNTTLRTTIEGIATKVTAIGGDIRHSHVSQSSPGLTAKFLFDLYGFGDCSLANVNVDASDGIVLSTSVSAEGQIRDATIVLGLDHSSLYALVGSANIDPLQIVADRLVSS